MEKQPRIDDAHKQDDLVLKIFLPKSDFASKAPLKKTTYRPRNQPDEKVRHFATLIVSKTSQYENGTFQPRPFCRNRDRQNPERGQSDRAGVNPCLLIMAKVFEKCDRRTDDQTLNLSGSPTIHNRIVRYNILYCHDIQNFSV